MKFVNSKLINGQSITELVVSIIIIIPVVLFLFDLAIMIIAVQTNDHIAKNAARVASQSDPLSAKLKAQTLISQARHNIQPFIKSLTMTNYSTNLTSQDILNWQNNGGLVLHVSTTNTVPGIVSITTQIKVQGFIIPWFIASGQNMSFNSTHQYPFSFASYDPAATANPWAIPATGSSSAFNQ